VFTITQQFIQWITQNIVTIKPTRCTNFSNLFCNKTLHVSDSSSVHHQEIFIVHTAIVYVIQVFWQLPSWSCSQAVSKPVWHTPLLCVQWKSPDDGQKNCPKHVEFYFKNKFEKLIHVVGFIVRIFQDARSPECQTQYILVINIKNLATCFGSLNHPQASFSKHSTGTFSECAHYGIPYCLQNILPFKLSDIHHCCVYSEELLMMDRGTVRNM